MEGFLWKALMTWATPVYTTQAQSPELRCGELLPDHRDLGTPW